MALAVDREQTTAVLDEAGQVRPGTKGEDALGRFTRETGLPVLALAGIRDVVHYLAREQVPVLVDGQKQPLDQTTMASFEQYLDTYGVSRS